MKSQQATVSVLLTLTLLAGVWLIAEHALAHCDTMDGPIVPEARRALESGDVTPLLKWIRAEDEDAIRDVFSRARAVRDRGADIREIVDRHFLESLIRIHRAGEGEPFTGLKPAGSAAPVFHAADAAIDRGSVQALADELSTAVSREIEERFATVMKRRQHVDDGVESGRAYVEAYVRYMHFIEGIHEFLEHGATEHHFNAAPAAAVDPLPSGGHSHEHH